MTTVQMLKLFLFLLAPGLTWSAVMLGWRSNPWPNGRLLLLLSLPMFLSMAVTGLGLECLTLAGLLSVKRLAAVNLLCAAPGVLLALPKWRQIAQNFPRPDSRLALRELLPVVVIAVYLWHTVWPFDFVFTTMDTGAYVGAGIHHMRSGGFEDHDEWFVSGDLNFRRTFYLYYPDTQFDRLGEVATGFTLRDRETGRITPRYLSMTSLWIGLFYGIFDLKTAVYGTIPFFGAVSLLGIMLTFREMLGWRVALAGGFLLANNVLFIWFGRYVTTEMPMSAFLFAALAVLLTQWNEKEEGERDSAADGLSGGVLAVFAGVAMGLTHLVRIDSILLVGAVFVYLTAEIVGRAPWSRVFTFAGAYAAVAALAVFHLRRVNWDYVQETFHHVKVPGERVLMVLVLGALGWLVATLLLRGPARGLLEWTDRHRAPLLRALGIGLVLLGCYAWFVRPQLVQIDPAAYDGMAYHARTYWLQHLSMVWMSWYLGPGLLAFGVVGGALLVQRYWRWRFLPLLSVCLLSTLYILYNQNCTPLHPWGMRRFAPVVVPTLLMSAAYALWRSWRWSSLNPGWRAHAARALIVLSIFISAGYSWDSLKVVRRLNHWGGALDFLEALNADLPQNAILVMSRQPGVYLNGPLHFIYNRRDCHVAFPPSRQGVALEYAAQWTKGGREVFLLWEGALPPVPAGVRADPVKKYSPRFTVLQQGMWGPSRGYFNFGFDLTLYRLVLENESPTLVP